MRDIIVFLGGVKVVVKFKRKGLPRKRGVVVKRRLLCEVQAFMRC
jgi:hypothetical protein